MGMFDFLKKNKTETTLPERRRTHCWQCKTARSFRWSPCPIRCLPKRCWVTATPLTPQDGKVLSPVSGTIIDIQDSLHAYGISTDDGLEVLVHIGINTVSLNGTGFQTKHKVGDKIHAGELLATVNLKLLEEKELPKFTVVLITDMDAVKAIHRSAGTAEAGKTAALTYEK